MIATPLWVERVAVRGADTPVVRTGRGRRASRRSARRLGGAAVLVAGVAGGLAPDVTVGDVVVASEVRGPDGFVRPCPTAGLLAERLRGLGLTVHCGPILSWPALVHGRQRHRLATTGALAVDMESAWLASGPERFAVVRVVSDTAAAPLISPAILTRGMTALRVLRRTVPGLDAWARHEAMEVT